jgi:integrase/recombinase XerD
MIKLTTYLGHANPEHAYWYIEAVPELLALASALSLIQQFFTDRLCTQLNGSPNTIASYRDTFRLLLRYASGKTGRPPTKLAVEDLNVELVADFLSAIERRRGNSARSRNTKLAGIRSYFRFVAMSEPRYMLHCQKIRAMPGKRYVRPTIEFLDRDEIDALMGARVGRRDPACRIADRPTGFRAYRSAVLRHRVRNRRTHSVRGKGAHSTAPLRRETVKVLAAWLKERKGTDTDPLFPSARGTWLGRDALEDIVRRHVLTASRSCPLLAGKRVSPHVLRHSTAMELLHHGVDQTVIALWLGHKNVETTQVYVYADLRLKEKALARVTPLKANPGST